MTIFDDKCKTYIPRLEKDLSISRIQACGIFGNLGGETGGFTALQEKNPTVSGSRGGWGWMQWTGPRRRKMEAWAKAKSLNPSADETNYQYLVEESLKDEYKSIVQLRKTNTLNAATETFMLLNLRPGEPHLDGRQRWAAKAWTAVSSAPSTPTVVTHDAPKPEIKKDGSWLTTIFQALMSLFKK